MKFNIAKQYSKTPGPRYIKLGPFSGEAFRDTVLVDLVKKSIEKKEKLEIDLDGVFGYPSSFLEEAFGGLIRNYNFDGKKILELFIFTSNDMPKTPEKIVNYIKDAINKRGY